ncbi:TolB family protein [Acidobacteriota bacterium]
MRLNPYYCGIFVILILVGILSARNIKNEEKEFPILEGPYLGQKPPGMMPEIFAPGVVSTENHEHSSLIMSTDGKEIFWSVISTPLSNQSSHKIVFMKYENNHWYPPKTVSFSGKYKDNCPFMSPDGKIIYFCSNRPFPGKRKSKDYELWFAKRTNSGWSDPRLLGNPFTEEIKTWQPSITDNGTIYFLGYLEGVQKEYGIYRSRFINGQYSKPELLNKSINTEYPDWCPYIAPDENYLIFSSKRPGGYGGFDLYISYQRNDGSWIEPQNLGSKINHKYHERFPGVSPDRKYLFFTRPNDENNGDIYWVDSKFIEELKPEDLK